MLTHFYINSREILLRVQRTVQNFAKTLLYILTSTLGLCSLFTKCLGQFI